MSIPCSTIVRFNGELSISSGNTFAGLRFANKSNFFLRGSNAALSGLSSGASLSASGCPTAPSKIASDFLQKIEEENSAIYYSGYLLKELSYVMGNVFSEKKHLFFDESRFKKLKADDEDYAFARKLEREFNFEISFFDCLHIVLTRKSKSILVTRDRKLLHFGKKYCAIGRPEEFL